MNVTFNHFSQRSAHQAGTFHVPRRYRVKSTITRVPVPGLSPRLNLREEGGLFIEMEERLKQAGGRSSLKQEHAAHNSIVPI